MVNLFCSHTKPYTNLVLALLVVSLLLPGCAGVQMAPTDPSQVYALQLGSTQWGVARAVTGAFDTFIMSDGSGNYMFSWAINDAWAFLSCKWGGGACVQSELLQKANLVNATTIGQFRAWLEEHGWKVVTPAELPTLLAAVLEGAATFMPTFLIVPAGSGWELQEYQDWNGEEWY